ncbi:uncharacterized protein C12orf73 homolog [Harpegnathos saltator]|uniref:uncharacterized protein C12orf73 homolog n=1 Tax=Harpegnathos saltator TaxID=610380 RepID=UPI0009488E07|nr:uncharacterized protein C12orf73 homolog [Harpegnathos saltator]
MPAGVSWPRYIILSASALLSMMAGAQCVHLIYKPLDDLDELVEKHINEQLKKEGKAS